MTIGDLVRLCGGNMDKMIILEVEAYGERGWNNIDITKQDDNTVYIESSKRELFDK